MSITMIYISVQIFGFLALLCTQGASQICRDKYRRFPNHTMCMSWSRRSQDHAKDEILDGHNAVRSLVLPPAANMKELEYFKTLGIEAQIWAEHCTLTHDDYHSRFQPARYDVGQNILTSKTNITWTKVLEQWQRENVTFKYGDPNNNMADVGNYAQLVYSEAQSVGCGTANCSGTYFYVCNYAPGMSTYDLARPYEVSNSGNSCDSCPLHCDVNGTSTMCGCEGKFCQNGGNLNLTTCECDCLGGVKSYDAKDYCSLTCEPNGDHTLCSTFNDRDCFTNKTVNFLCPWKCGICPWGGKTYREGSVPLPWDCEIPKNITNGHVTHRGFKEGSTARYDCNPGYLMSTGNKTRVCKNGKWTGDAPTCNTLEEIRQILSVCRLNSNRGSGKGNIFSFRGGKGSPVGCLAPNTVNNSQVTVTHLENAEYDVATYCCDEGYTLVSGNQTLKCDNYDGHWLGMEPECQAKPVPPGQSNTSGRHGCNGNGAGRSLGSTLWFGLLVWLYGILL